MFLVRSIRRRLVSLFSVSLLLMIVLAVIGIFGLVWHQEAVDDLDFLLHRSPNQDHLSRAVGRIGESLFSRLDLRRPAAAEEMKAQYLADLRLAEAELFEFRKRIEALPLADQVAQHQRDQVIGRLDKIYGELFQLWKLSDAIRPLSNSDDNTRLHEIQHKAGTAIALIQKSLDNLPAYQTRDWVELSLTKERQRSARLLQFLIWGTVVVVTVYVVVMICGLNWISAPVRSIAKGCTRIANGDISFRLPSCSRWQDEFADLVAGVNCMADRFQQAEEDLQEKVRERSEQLVRSQGLANVGFLAAGVAHEINNPLSAISLAADSLEMRLYEMDDPQSETCREILDRVSMIRRESRRCGEITARLLDFSRGDKGAKANTDLSELVREVLAMVRHLGKFSDRTVEFDCDKTVTAEVSSAQIKQVILNLVANGLQATHSGGRVVIRLQEQVDNVVLAVTDDGCGMDSTTLQHIFDPFFTTRDAGQGTGLGLSITHRIVEDHGGTVTPLSEGLNRGSTFQVRLPRRQRRAHAA
ncbi:MAG: ATP-binding protein [Planctomycetaceae bacterium]